MTPKKPGAKTPRTTAHDVPDGKTLSVGERSETTESTNKRKPWVKKTPVEVVLEQIQKQETKVSEMENEVKKEQNELQKLLKAKAVLEDK